jgi:hypothetical protein
MSTPQDNAFIWILGAKFSVSLSYSFARKYYFKEKMEAVES